MTLQYKKIAIVGSGISGLSVAHSLQGQADITLFEAGSYFGGHTNTVNITLPTAQGPRSYGVDTGFLVFTERNYPNLINLLAQLGVPTRASEMSFSVQVPGAWGGEALEWSGSSLDSVFAQRKNLLRPRFLKMLADLLRFNVLCTRIAQQKQEREMRQTLAEFLKRHHFSQAFCDWYFLPMMACIWSCPTDQMLQFPVASMIRFCHNHGLIQVSNRPKWHTVVGGAQNYVQKIVAPIADKRLNTPVRLIERDAQGVRVVSDDHAERFDEVVLCTHSDQSLAMLRDASENEKQILSAIRYQANRAVLHTDESVLPKRRKAWAAWNYERAAHANQEGARVCLHYLLNRLQALPFEQAVVVSLNPIIPIAADKILGAYDYAHPVFDLAALDAQNNMHQIQGRNHTWFAGAWMGYGFHEDGLKAGLSVARELLLQVHT